MLCYYYYNFNKNPILKRKHFGYNTDIETLSGMHRSRKVLISSTIINNLHFKWHHVEMSARCLKVILK